MSLLRVPLPLRTCFTVMHKVWRFISFAYFCLPCFATHTKEQSTPSNDLIYSLIDYLAHKICPMHMYTHFCVVYTWRTKSGYGENSISILPVFILIFIWVPLGVAIHFQCFCVSECMFDIHTDLLNAPIFHCLFTSARRKQSLWREILCDWALCVSWGIFERQFSFVFIFINFEKFNNTGHRQKTIKKSHHVTKLAKLEMIQTVHRPPNSMYIYVLL